MHMVCEGIHLIKSQQIHFSHLNLHCQCGYVYEWLLIANFRKFKLVQSPWRVSGKEGGKNKQRKTKACLQLCYTHDRFQWVGGLTLSRPVKQLVRQLSIARDHYSSSSTSHILSFVLMKIWSVLPLQIFPRLIFVAPQTTKSQMAL